MLDHFQNINICSKLFSTRFELGSQNNVTYLLSLKFLWTVRLLSNFNCIREARDVWIYKPACMILTKGQMAIRTFHMQKEIQISGHAFFFL